MANKESKFVVVRISMEAYEYLREVALQNWESASKSASRIILKDKETKRV
jgi:hypothetical protein